MQISRIDLIICPMKQSDDQAIHKAVTFNPPIINALIEEDITKLFEEFVRDKLFKGSLNHD